METPKIFDIIVFNHRNGLRCVDVHHVAAFTSAQAEELYLSFHRDHACDGGTYIMSDDCAERHHNPAARLYVNSDRNQCHISDTELIAWINRNTRGHFEDGVLIPAGFRIVVVL